jgi:acyl-CoA thioester hydrolase
MSIFNFSYSIEVRYGDIDAQGHLNNAKYLTFMEHARFKYVERVGLWQTAAGFDKLGQIVARVTCDYKRPVCLGQVVEVAARTARLGTKSMEMEFRLTADGQVVALGTSVQVAYDYQTERSIPLPARWRELIGRFEGWPA